uniref:Uncharacterized protein n=1 Tax=Strigamia maritima TaxID=126957 RepID=T1IRP2_STRMM
KATELERRSRANGSAFENSNSNGGIIYSTFGNVWKTCLILYHERRKG